MFYLRLCGTPSLESDGATITGRAAQRHRLALLALLALAPGRRLSRDKLIACLWPDRDNDGGRNLLKVATYVLRGTLGDQALNSQGDDLQLDAALIDVDVAEFDRAVEQQDYARAVALYRGPFLDGFFLSDAPEFERWVDRERDRLTGSYRAALEALAEAAEAGGDFAKAVEFWKQRAAHDLYDSRVALRLMQCLEAAGNRAGALQHASVHERLLQAEFEIGLPAAMSDFVEQLRREPVISMATSPSITEEFGASSYLPEPIGPAAMLPASIEIRETNSSEPEAVPTDPRTKGPPRLPRRWLAFAAVVVVVALTAAFLVTRPRDSDPERSIAVLPFLNLSPEQDVEFFSDGLTEEVITRLAALPELRVISRTSVMRYKESKLSLPEIARQLNVTHVLEGSVRHSDGNVRITAQLVAARGDDHLWAKNYDYRLNDSFRAQEEIAHEVARALSIELSEPTRKVLAKHGTNDPQAYELYRRGRMFWNLRTREAHELAMQYFQRALERDSSYAAAWAGLADAYHTAWQLNLTDLSEDDTYSKARRAAERALALDPESSDAHTSLATSQLWQHNLPAAERLFTRAIELSPSNAAARTWHALTLRAMGRIDEARQEGRLAAELDPFAAVAISNYGWLCYLDRDYDCALREYRKSLDVNPNWDNARRGAAFAYARKGMHAEALQIMTSLVATTPHRPDFLADFAVVQALAGRDSEARETLRRAKLEPIKGMNIARAHAALGETDSAFVWLEHAQWHWPARAILADPGLDPLRSNPRFAQLANRVERNLRLK